MSEVAPPEQDLAPPEPTWDIKVVLLNTELARLGVPYAFGGAIALNYHREPRSTIDIDINVFLPPDSAAEVLGALDTISGHTDRDRLDAEIRRDGQTRASWGNTLIDLFYSNTDFHTSMAQRVKHEPFGDAHIPVLSIEDLLVCKALFDRPKDWVDIDAVARVRGPALDYDYVRHWLGEFVPADDPRFDRLQNVVDSSQ